MLIFHGANDVRCKVAESDMIVAAMQARNIPVTYVVYPDEGHGFQKPPNRLSYIAIAEAFFARHLGGAFEPVGRRSRRLEPRERGGRRYHGGFGRGLTRPTHDGTRSMKANIVAQSPATLALALLRCVVDIRRAAAPDCRCIAARASEVPRRACTPQTSSPPTPIERASAISLERTAGDLTAERKWGG